MDDDNQIKTITIGKYVFTKIEENQFYLYRNDGEELGDIGTLPIEIYHYYLLEKGEDKRWDDNLIFEMSKDGKCIRITPICLDKTIYEETKGIKRLVKKLLVFKEEKIAK